MVGTTIQPSADIYNNQGNGWDYHTNNYLQIFTTTMAMAGTTTQPSADIYNNRGNGWDYHTTISRYLQQPGKWLGLPHNHLQIFTTAREMVGTTTQPSADIYNSQGNGWDYHTTISRYLQQRILYFRPLKSFKLQQKEKHFTELHDLCIKNIKDMPIFQHKKMTVVTNN